MIYRSNNSKKSAMRKILFTLIILLSGIQLFSQMPTNGDYTNWNWEDQTYG